MWLGPEAQTKRKVVQEVFSVAAEERYKFMVLERGAGSRAGVLIMTLAAKKSDSVKAGACEPLIDG